MTARGRHYTGGQQISSGAPTHLLVRLLAAVNAGDPAAINAVAGREATFNLLADTADVLITPRPARSRRRSKK